MLTSLSVLGFKWRIYSTSVKQWTIDDEKVYYQIKGW